MAHRRIQRRPLVAPMSRPPSPHRAKGLELLQGGATAAEVAAQLGVSVRTVESWAASLGLRQPGERGAGAGPRIEALPVVDLLLQGEPIAEIAAALRISRQAVEEVRDRWISDDES